MSFFFRKKLYSGGFGQTDEDEVLKKFTLFQIQTMLSKKVSFMSRFACSMYRVTPSGTQLSDMNPAVRVRNADAYRLFSGGQLEARNHGADCQNVLDVV
jgi:hypothetical protein